MPCHNMRTLHSPAGCFMCRKDQTKCVYANYIMCMVMHNYVNKVTFAIVIIEDYAHIMLAVPVAWPLIASNGRNHSCELGFPVMHWYAYIHCSWCLH